MSVKESLKKNDFLRRIVKKVKIYLEFLGDAKDYSESYLEAAERQGDYRYRVLLLTHSLEKGMCMNNLRPFGREKANQLVDILMKTGRQNENQFEYDLGVSILSAWVKMYDDYGWNKDNSIIFVEEFLKGKAVYYDAGKKSFIYPTEKTESTEFSDVMLSRHSVRDFEARDLKASDVEYAIKMFIEAPTACNRQMCRVYQVKNHEIVNLLNNTILGVGGFNKDTMHYFRIFKKINVSTQALIR